MNNKWNNLRILITWLKQGRQLEMDGDTFGISDEEDILHMITEDRGIPLPSLGYIWSLVNKISEQKFMLMAGEVSLTEMNRESADRRIIKMVENEQ